jgi:hypothetical protein
MANALMTAQTIFFTKSGLMKATSFDHLRVTPQTVFHCDVPVKVFDLNGIIIPPGCEGPGMQKAVYRLLAIL